MCTRTEDKRQRREAAEKTRETKGNHNDGTKKNAQGPAKKRKREEAGAAGGTDDLNGGSEPEHKKQKQSEQEAKAEKQKKIKVRGIQCPWLGYGRTHTRSYVDIT